MDACRFISETGDENYVLDAIDQRMRVRDYVLRLHAQGRLSIGRIMQLGRCGDRPMLVARWVVRSVGRWTPGRYASPVPPGNVVSLPPEFAHRLPLEVLELLH